MAQASSERAAHIRERREALRLTQEALAQAAGVKRTWLAAVERGRVSTPDQEMLASVERTLDAIDSGEMRRPRPTRPSAEAGVLGRRFSEVYGNLDDKLRGLARRMLEGLADLSQIEDELSVRFVLKSIEVALSYAASARLTKTFTVEHRGAVDLWRELLEAANSGDHIRATSYVDPDTWWRTQSGLYYRHLNRVLRADRSCRTSRVFIFDDAAERPKVLDEAQEQAQYEVHVHLVASQSLAVSPRDLIVVGDHHAGWLDLDARRRVVRSNWTTDEEQIMGRGVDFELLFDAPEAECIGGDPDCPKWKAQQKGQSP